MQKIPIDLAAPGMILAKPVTKENGMTIMAEGMELSQSLIDRLSNMNVDRITVQGHPVDMGGAGAGTKYAERVVRMDHLFRRHKPGSWMDKVRVRIKQYFQIKAAAQEARAKALSKAKEPKPEPGEELEGGA